MRKAAAVGISILTLGIGAALAGPAEAAKEGHIGTYNEKSACYDAGFDYIRNHRDHRFECRGPNYVDKWLLYVFLK